MEWLVALIALALMEIILGIDNLVFIAIVTAKLPQEQRPFARRIGLALALVMRILLLLTLKWLLGLESPLFALTDLGIPEWLLRLFDANAAHAHGNAFEEMNLVSLKDLILIAGGLFLIAKSVHEIHGKFHGEGAHHSDQGKASFGSVLFQIMVLDIIFSLDSVITAVGMAEQLWVMIVAVILAVAVMIIFANPISNFIERYPTLTMLALSFLILIGVMLVAEGIGTHINKGYIYFAMAFSIVVEILNMKLRGSEQLTQPKTA